MIYCSSILHNRNYAYSDIYKYLDMIKLHNLLCKKNFNNDHVFFSCKGTSDLLLKNGIKNSLIDDFVDHDFFWSYFKLYTSSLVKRPFCSIDIDCFVWNSDVLKNLDEYDFAFYSIDSPIGDTLSRHYRLYCRGINILREITSKDHFDFYSHGKSFGFNSYNFGILLCNDIHVYNDYFNKLSAILSDINIDLFRYSVPNCISVSIVLEQLLLSKIIFEKKSKVKCIYPSIKYGMRFPINKDKDLPVTHLMSMKKNKNVMNFIKKIVENYEHPRNNQ